MVKGDDEVDNGTRLILLNIRSRGFDAAGEGGADSSGWTRRSVRPAPPPLSATGPLPERPIIRLQPRTKPLNENAEDVAMSARHTAIFGAAKPVDTAAIERQLEEVGSGKKSPPL